MLLALMTARDRGRLNSPNDLVYRLDGLLYFTDSPSGLPGGETDPQRELPFSGVYLLSNGRRTVVSTELIRPNGLALSPDEDYLYVGSSGRDAVVMRHVVLPDGTLSKGRYSFGRPFMNHCNTGTVLPASGYRVGTTVILKPVGFGGAAVLSTLLAIRPAISCSTALSRPKKELLERSNPASV